MTQFPSRKIVGQDRPRNAVGDQIEAIEKEIRETPYHKGTERHIGLLRARLAKLKDRQVESATKKGGGGGGYAVKKQGDATIVLAGPPSVGKSTLINKLTNAQSKVAPYAFTTVSVIPGMMDYQNAKIQILDVPGLIEGAEEGKGRGREVLSVVRGADLLVVITQVGKENAIPRIKAALERNGIRIDKQRPDVLVDKKLDGGITLHSNIKQDLDKDTIKTIASEFGVKNAEITLREKLTMESLIDAFSTNRVYVPSISLINKVDTLPKNAKKWPEAFYISAEDYTNLDQFKEAVWKKLGFVRVYLVKPGDEPSFNEPIITNRTETLGDIAEKIGTDFAENKKKAKIWGAGAKFPGQEVSLSTEVLEGMQVRFV